KESDYVGDQSRLDFGTRGLELKQSFKDKKSVRLGKYPGAEVILEDKMFKEFETHRIYVARDRLYHLQAKARNVQGAPPEFAKFFASFQITGAPEPGDLPPELIPVPGAIVRFTEAINGKQLLGKMLPGAREAKHEGKTYLVGPLEAGLLGMPVAGHLADD